MTDYYIGSLFEKWNNKKESIFIEINKLNNEIFRIVLPSHFNANCREGQLQMSQDIIDILQLKHKKRKCGNLMIEAGVGIGKSYAYLIPLLLYNNYMPCKTVLSTSSILLQNQLVNDIKELQEILSNNNIKIAKPDIVIAKGKNRYICIDRLKKYKNKEQTILEIKKEYTDGKRVEEIESNYSEIDDMISVKRCTKNKCQFKDECSFYKMRNVAKKKERNIIIVTNHDMFVQDRKLYKKHFDYSIFGEVQNVVFDEAHNLEDKVRSAYLFILSKNSIKSLLKRIENQNIFNSKYTIINACDEITKITNNLFKKLKSNVEKKIESLDDAEKPLRLEFKLIDYEVEIKNICNQIDIISEEVKYVGMLDDVKYRKNKDNTEDTIRDIQITLDQIHMYLNAIITEDDNYLSWIEIEYFRDHIDEKKLAINTSIKHIGKNLNDLVFSNENLNVILTSATLSSSSNLNDFDDPEDAYSYIANSVGLICDQNYTLLNEPIKSPYNYNENMKIFVDESVPAPEGNKHYIPELTEAIKRALKLTNGKTLILFTSKYDMLQVYKYLKEMKLSYRLLVQKGNSFKVLNEFKEDTDSVLLSTGNFWEGINVPGETLSQVIIARLPFPVPDPILNDKKNRFLQSGKNGQDYVNEVIVPEMLIKLRQGIGRLIRKEDDRGIITILDSRIANKSKSKYKNTVRKSLPVMPTDDIKDLEVFSKEIF